MEVKRHLEKIIYQPVAPINAFHEVPRFGHTSDISSVFANTNGDEGDRADYIWGTVFVACFFLTLLVVWLLVLAVCKCFGKRAGICGGHPFIEHKSLNAKISCKPAFFKMLMTFFSVLIILNGLLFLFKGTVRSSAVFRRIRVTSRDFMAIIDDIVQTTDRAIEFGSNTGTLKRDLMSLSISGICDPPVVPGLQPGSVPGLEAGSEFATLFDNSITTIAEELDIIEEFSQSGLVDVRDTFASDFTDAFDRIDEIVDVVESNVEIGLGAIPVILFGALLLLGSFLAWFCPNLGIYFLFQTWFIVPVFSLLLIAVGIAIAFIGSFLVLNSDVCLGGDSRSPEGTLEALLSADEGGTLMDAMKYYVLEGCEGKFVMKEEADFVIQELGKLDNVLEDMFANLDANRPMIEASCGLKGGALDPRQRSLRNLIGAFQDFVEIIRDASSAMECERINSVFISIFHGLLCTDVPYSLSWMFATMVPLSLIGMFMILCRGALLPSQMVDDNDEAHREYCDEENTRRYDTDQAINGEDSHLLENDDEDSTNHSTDSKDLDIEESKALKDSYTESKVLDDEESKPLKDS